MPSADVTPGTISNGIAASASASASSPPRPNRNGSPPFSRTTLSPRRARSISIPAISDLNNLEWNRGIRQRLGLFSAAPKQERIPALQPHHSEPAPRPLNKHPRDLRSEQSRMESRHPPAPRPLLRRAQTGTDPRPSAAPL